MAGEQSTYTAPNGYLDGDGVYKLAVLIKNYIDAYGGGSLPTVPSNSGTYILQLNQGTASWESITIGGSY